MPFEHGSKQGLAGRPWCGEKALHLARESPSDSPETESLEKENEGFFNAHKIYSGHWLNLSDK